jgi:ribosome-associated protein
MPDRDNEAPDASEEVISKSAIKRRMTELQQLGESLTQLSDKQLSKVPISDERLLQAIHEARRIRSNSAHRRHLQFIGKLMRDIDPEPIEQALGAMDQQQQRSRDAFHELEQLRDRILAQGPDGVEQALQRWPQADRQHLRRLTLQHQREVQRNNPPSAGRKLFRYLRELQELYG